MLARQREAGITSEIHPHADRNDALPARGCDAAEISRIDVRVRTTELRTIQQVDRVTSYDQFLVLMQTNLLEQVQVEAECTGTFQVSWRTRTRTAGGRIHCDQLDRLVRYCV